MPRRRPRRRSHRLGRLSLGVVLLALIAALAMPDDWELMALLDPPGSRPASPRQIDFSGRVTRIVDGDTFWISGQNVRIRIWGLDAPETGEPGGAAATAELTRLIGGETLNCRQRDIDRFGRIVGQCFLPDGRDITREMIRSGTATEFCRFSRNYYGTC